MFSIIYFLIKIIEGMENCSPHIVTYLQYGYCRLSRLHTVTLRQRLAPKNEVTWSCTDILQNKCFYSIHKIQK